MQSKARKYPWGARLLSGALRRSKVRFAPFFFLKNIRPLPCSSFFAKRHARLADSVAITLVTAHCCYHLFASAPAVQGILIGRLFQKNRTIWIISKAFGFYVGLLIFWENSIGKRKVDATLFLTKLKLRTQVNRYTINYYIITELSYTKYIF